MDNVHISEMHVHYSDLVFQVKAEKKKKNVSPLSGACILRRDLYVLCDFCDIVGLEILLKPGKHICIIEHS